MTPDIAGRPRRDELLWAAGLALALGVTVWSHQAQWGADPVLALAYSLIGLGWMGMAWLLRRQPEQGSNARMFLLLSVVWMVGEVARKDIAVLYPVTLFASQYPQILCPSLLLRYPRGRFDRAGWAYLVSGLAFATAFAVPAVLLAPSPGRPGDAPGRILESIGSYRFGDVQFAKSLYWAVFSVIFLTLFFARWRRLTKFERSTLTPILFSAVAATVTIGAAVVEPVLPSEVARGLRLARGLAGVGVSAAFLASAQRLRLARATVADLVERLSGPVTERSIREALVDVFGDSA